MMRGLWLASFLVFWPVFLLALFTAVINCLAAATALGFGAFCTTVGTIGRRGGCRLLGKRNRLFNKTSIQQFFFVGYTVCFAIEWGEVGSHPRTILSSRQVANWPFLLGDLERI